MKALPSAALRFGLPAALLLWGVAGMVGSLSPNFGVLNAAQPHLCLVLIASALGYGALRQPIQTSLLGLIALWHGVFMLPWIVPIFWTPAEPTGSFAGETSISLLLFNQHANNDRYDQTVPFLSENGADILVICEANHHLLDRLAHLHETYPYRIDAGRWIGSHTAESSGTVIWSRWPFRTSTALPIPATPVQAVSAVIELPFGPIELIAMHPPSPRTRREHRINLRCLSEAPSLASGDYPLILAGDLNTAIGSAALRRLEASTALRSVYRDQGLRSSWPAFAHPFGITIDHILIPDQLLCIALDSLPPHGSDHRPILARLTTRP